MKLQKKQAPRSLIFQLQAILRLEIFNIACSLFLATNQTPPSHDLTRCSHKSISRTHVVIRRARIRANFTTLHPTTVLLRLYQTVHSVFRWYDGELIFGRLVKIKSIYRYIHVIISRHLSNAILILVLQNYYTSTGHHHHYQP